VNTDDYDYLAQRGASGLTEARLAMEDLIQSRASYRLQLSEAKDNLESSGQPSDSRLARIIARCEVYGGSKVMK